MSCGSVDTTSGGYVFAELELRVDPDHAVAVEVGAAGAFVDSETSSTMKTS